MKKKIIPKLLDFCAANARKLNDETYEINVGGICARRSSIRHELYHIYRGHLEPHWSDFNSLLSALTYSLIEEPQAIAYEIFGLKI